MEHTISYDKPTKYTFQDLTGMSFGRLTVEGYAYTKNYESFWHCICVCGEKKVVNGKPLKRGDTKSCGCLNKELSTTHGKWGHPLRFVWGSMKDRCTNSNNKYYKYYGGRGISICEEWKTDFKAFYEWAINNGWQKGLQIDRENNNGNYEPSNCRWATQKTQLRNTSRTVLNPIKVRIILCLKNKYLLDRSSISDVLSINRHTVDSVLYNKAWVDIKTNII